MATIAELDALIEQCRSALETELTSGAPPVDEYTIGDRRVKRTSLLTHLLELQKLRNEMADTGTGVDLTEIESLFDDPNF